MNEIVNAQTIKLVKAELQHLSLITPLFDAYRMFYQQPSDMQSANKFLSERLTNNESAIYFAANDEQTSAYGFVQLYTKFGSISMRKILLLNDLYVYEAHRQKGIGHMLMTIAKRHAIENGFASIELETAPSNKTAQTLYLSHGYKNREHKYHTYYLDLHA